MKRKPLQWAPVWKLLIIAALAVTAASIPCRVDAGATLDKIRRNNQLRCGVNEGLEGFSFKDGGGNWRGLDADFCRAVAAAALGNPDKVKFVPLATPARFPALKLDTIDLLVRNTTYTFRREAELGLHFAGILYYDHQALLVSRHAKVRRLSDLNGATICVVKGTTTEAHLAGYFKTRSLRYQPMIFNTDDEARNALFAGHCQALTSDASQLNALLLQTQKGSDQFMMLPDILSKEPLGPVLRRGDEEWLTLVKWVLFALIEAEEQGVSRLNARFQYDENADLSVQAFLGASGGFGKALGISDDWVVRVIESVGNYGEMFERNVGKQSRLQLDRGLNRLWSSGGIMYAPPMY